MCPLSMVAHVFQLSSCSSAPRAGQCRQDVFSLLWTSCAGILDGGGATVPSLARSLGPSRLECNYPLLKEQFRSLFMRIGRTNLLTRFKNEAWTLLVNENNCPLKQCGSDI